LYHLSVHLFYFEGFAPPSQGSKSPTTNLVGGLQPPDKFGGFAKPLHSAFMKNILKYFYINFTILQLKGLLWR